MSLDPRTHTLVDVPCGRRLGPLPAQTLAALRDADRDVLQPLVDAGYVRGTASARRFLLLGRGPLLLQVLGAVAVSLAGWTVPPALAVTLGTSLAGFDGALPSFVWCCLLVWTTSTATHEYAHLAVVRGHCGRRSGALEVRRLNVCVVRPELTPGTARLCAAVGPLTGMLTCTALLAVPYAPLRAAAAVLLAAHTVNLMPASPDGSDLWQRDLRPSTVVPRG